MTTIPYFEDKSAGIVLYCGDCREILPTLDAYGECLITDPPYGVNLNTEYAAASRSVLAQNRDFLPVYGDDKPFDPAHLLQFKQAVLWGANYYANKLPAEGAWLVWDKRDGVVYNDQADAELAWTRGTGGTVPRIYRHLWNGMLKDSEHGDARFHPTQKPVALMRWTIGFFPSARLIVDPYAGSGTTLVAAKSMGKRAIGIEISEAYCAIIVERLRQGVLAL